MKAELVYRAKSILSDDSILEMVIWRVPESVPGSVHRYKYRLYFGKAGRRFVGYDNERGKGDHKHLDGNELPYIFVSFPWRRLCTTFSKTSGDGEESNENSENHCQERR